MLTIATAALLALAPPAQDRVEHTKDSIDTIRKNLNDGKAVIVDVREQREWDAGHLEGAVLLSLSWLREAGPEELEKKIPGKKILYLHCRSGRRVLAAAPILRKAGADARPLRHGYDALRKAGFKEASREP